MSTYKELNWLAAELNSNELYFRQFNSKAVRRFVTILDSCIDLDQLATFVRWVKAIDGPSVSEIKVRSREANIPTSLNYLIWYKRYLLQRRRVHSFNKDFGFS